MTLTATASGGFAFNGWSGDCTGTSTTCIVTMSQARDVTADFGPPTQLLTVTKAGSGSGTVTSDVAGINCGATCSASFADGTVVTLTAVRSLRLPFTGWSGDCSGTGTCIVTMSVARNVTATFVAQYTLAVTKSGIGHGDRHVASAASTAAPPAARTTRRHRRSRSPRPPGRLALHRLDGRGCSGTGTCAVTMSQARNVTAGFVALYTLTVTKSGSGAGTVSSDVGAIDCGVGCSADYDDGTVVTLTAAATSGLTLHRLDRRAAPERAPARHDEPGPQRQRQLYLALHARP